MQDSPTCNARLTRPHAACHPRQNKVMLVRRPTPFSPGPASLSSCYNKPRARAVTGRHSAPSPATEFPVPNARARARTHTHVLPPSCSLSSFSLSLSQAIGRSLTRWSLACSLIAACASTTACTSTPHRHPNDHSARHTPWIADPPATNPIPSPRMDPFHTHTPA